MSAAPFDKKQVREAANLAVNKEAIVKNVLGGRGIVMAGPFTPAWLGYDPSVKPFAYDPAKAKALLAEAGYPQGFDTTWSISSGVLPSANPSSPRRTAIQAPTVASPSASRTMRPMVERILEAEAER